MSEGGTPFVYIYLDRTGIESLYAQITDRLEIDFVQSKTREGRGEVGASAKFGNLLTSLLGVKELGARTELEAVRRYSDEVRTTLTAEHKLQLLLDHLTKAKECFGSLEEAANKSSVGHFTYVSAVEYFDAPDFYSGSRDVREINESGSMVFTIDRKYDSSDEYFKRINFSFVMAASLKKFTRLNGCMGATCHEAIMFSGFRGRRIPLGVFGHVMRYSDTACQVKPYAIWLVTSYRARM